MAVRKDSRVKVSVIVPVFNVEIYLEECLKSLINQTLKEIEIILIDDKSSDNSGEICDRYGELDSRIRVIHNKSNIRQGLSRNKGIEIARGEFIGFVDADDYVDLDFYEKLYHSAKKNNTNIAKAKVRQLYSDGRIESTSNLNNKILKGIKEGTPLFVNFGYEHWTAIYNRKKLLKYDVLYPDIRNGQDDIFLLDSTYHLKSISLISDTYYNYRQHSSSTISIRKQPYFDSITTVFRNKMNFINNHEISKSDYLSYFYLSLHIINIRYNELKLIKELEQYKRQFVSEVLEILKMYKYDKYDLLTNMYIGFGKIIKPEKLLKEDYTYKIYRRLKSVKAKIFG